MASIAISNLHPVGFDLFSSYESFMTELTEEEISIKGGISPLVAGVALGAGAMYLYYEYIE